MFMSFILYVEVLGWVADLVIASTLVLVTVANSARLNMTDKELNSLQPILDTTEHVASTIHLYTRMQKVLEQRSKFTKLGLECN